MLSVIIKRFLKSISGEKVIGNYTVDDIVFLKKEILLSDNLSLEEINNFLLIGKNQIIKFMNQTSIPDERKFLDNLVKIFKILQKHNRTYNISISIESRKLLEYSQLLNYTDNINLTIVNGYSKYSKEEYLQEEDKLEQLVKSINVGDLTPYEKYLAVYNIVKQFKPYKDSLNDSYQSRAIKYILDNEYMVCVGYSDLLIILLEKVDILSYGIHTNVDVSYDNGFTMENIPTDLRPHRRNIVKIDDDKYNIHGIFIVDSTLDNDMENDLYHNSAMTFDKNKESSRLESLICEDLLLDFHDFKDFSEKINFYLRRLINKSPKNKYEDKIIDAYKNLYQNIMKIIVKLDYTKYCELYQKFNNDINKYIEQFKKHGSITLNCIEDILSSFLTEYFQYITIITNKPIDESILYQAARNVKKIVNGYNEKELEQWEEETIKINRKKQSKVFPYVYNPDEKRLNYLGDARYGKDKKK